MKTRPGHLQIRLPEFVAPSLGEWAFELNWYSKGNRPGSTIGHSLHMSLVMSAAIAGLSRESKFNRTRILRNGRQFIASEEVRRNVPGSSRVRAFSINAQGQLEKLT